MVGVLELKARPAVYFDDIQVYPNLKAKSALVKIKVINQLMRGKSVPPKTVIPPGPLTQRLSTGCLALTQPHLKEAVRVIDGQYHALLTVDDIAAAAGVSRRQLYLLFQSEMRCSPCDYLLSVRLDHALKLIAKNEFHLNQIAQTCGFNTPRSLLRAFHQRFGVAPSKWAKADHPLTC